MLNCIPYEASKFLLPELDDEEFYNMPIEEHDELKKKQ